MKTNELLSYWRRGAAEDLKTAEALFRSKRYVPCLFFCHLMLEKILKALVVKKTGGPAPYWHHLPRLAEESGATFASQQLDLLANINVFNIQARYNDYTLQLHKKATRAYTQRYLRDAKNLYLWLAQKF